MAGRIPSTWDEYERGASPARSGSISSFGNRSEVVDDQWLQGDADYGDGTGRDRQANLRHRRSSVTRQLAALTDIGGVNSIRSFSRSWARAAGFQEVIPQRPSFFFAPDQDPTHPTDGVIQYGRISDVEAGGQPRTSLLGQSLLQQTFAPPSSSLGPSPSIIDGPANSAQQDPLLNSLHPVTSYGSTTDFRERERKALENELAGALSFGTPGRGIFGEPPHLASSPIIGSYSSMRSHGTIASNASRVSIVAAGPLWRQQQEAAGAAGLGDQPQPILVKEVEQDGKIVLAVEGQSTLPQTVFNSINVLIGVGLLSLPLGLRYSGWIPGMITLFLAAAVTAYTAKLLAKCMDLDVSLITFSDVAFISFGTNARLFTSVLFSMELIAANVALMVLFADSIDLLFPGALTVTQWKIVCAVLLLPLNFLPLRLLSFTSVIGIFSCAAIVIIIITDGLIKRTAPGSLIEPATTYLWPANWLTLPLSFGLLMSPWGGHSVFPNIYRDMRHPHRYSQAIKYTFVFTYLLDAATAIVGLLMFGDDVLDEVSSSILKTSGYPRALTFLMCLFIAIIPLTKIPLSARPIIATVEVLIGLHGPPKFNEDGVLEVEWWRGPVQIAIRLGTILVFLAMSILFPAFDSIMAFMGSALCFTICVILPVAFYLKLFYKDISSRERIFCWFLIVTSSILSLVGTLWAFLPKNIIGADN